MPRPEPRRPNSLRLRAHDYSCAGAYFVTVCVADRACLLGDVEDDEVLLSDLGRLVEACWLAIPAHCRGVTLDGFVVMPNHVHGIVWLSGARHASPLRVVVGGFKAASSRAAGRSLWQRSFHDRVIRDAELRALRQYVDENPLRWGLGRGSPAA